MVTPKSNRVDITFRNKQTIAPTEESWKVIRTQLQLPVLLMDKFNSIGRSNMKFK